MKILLLIFGLLSGCSHTLPLQEPNPLELVHVQTTEEIKEIRISCYNYILPGYPGQPIFLDATEEELSELRILKPSLDLRHVTRGFINKYGSPEDKESGDYGEWVFIEDITLEGSVANVYLTNYFSPEGGASHHARLTKKEGKWTVISVETLAVY